MQHPGKQGTAAWPQHVRRQCGSTGKLCCHQLEATGSWCGAQVPLTGGTSDNRVSEGCLESVLQICPRKADVRLAEFAWQMLNGLIKGAPLH